MVAMPNVEYNLTFKSYCSISFPSTASFPYTHYDIFTEQQ